jgi:hypothetical protein
MLQVFQNEDGMFPQEIIDKYNLANNVPRPQWQHQLLQLGMYGLPQAGIIAQELLKECLLKAGYSQSVIGHGLLAGNTPR